MVSSGFRIAASGLDPVGLVFFFTIDLRQVLPQLHCVIDKIIQVAEDFLPFFFSRFCLHQPGYIEVR